MSTFKIKNIQNFEKAPSYNGQRVCHVTVNKGGHKKSFSENFPFKGERGSKWPSFSTKNIIIIVKLSKDKSNLCYLLAFILGCYEIDYWEDRNLNIHLQLSYELTLTNHYTIWLYLTGMTCDSFICFLTNELIVGHTRFNLSGLKVEVFVCNNAMVKFCEIWSAKIGVY